MLPTRILPLLSRQSSRITHSLTSSPSLLSSRTLSLHSLAPSSSLSSSSLVPLSSSFSPFSSNGFSRVRTYSRRNQDEEQYYQQQQQQQQQHQQHYNDQYQHPNQQHYNDQYQQHYNNQYQQHQHPDQQHYNDQYQQHQHPDHHHHHQDHLQEHPDQQQQPQQQQSKASRVASVAGGSMLLFGGKAKSALAALKLTKFSSLISMGASTLAYSFLFGLPYAAGMVGLILLHESGHALMMHHYKIPFSPMVFIPFMGAAVGMKEIPKCPREMAMVALAGPALGGLGALGVYLTGVSMDSQLLLALGNFGMMINLFNLLPIGSMDGGRVAEILSKWFLVGGWGVGVGMLYSGVVSSPLFYLIMLSATWTTGKRVLGYHTPLFLEKDVPRGVKGEVLLVYLGITGGLLYGMSDSVKRMKPPAQIRKEMVEEGGEEELGEFAEALFTWSDEEELKDD